MLVFIDGEINILGVKKKNPTAWTLVSLGVHAPKQHVEWAWSKRKEVYFLFLRFSSVQLLNRVRLLTRENRV